SPPVRSHRRANAAPLASAYPPPRGTRYHAKLVRGVSARSPLACPRSPLWYPRIIPRTLRPLPEVAAIAFACQQLGLEFQVKAEFAGRKTKCPTCKQPLVVPDFERTLASVSPGPVDGTISTLHRAGLRHEESPTAPPSGEEPDTAAPGPTGGSRYVVH